MTFSIGQIPSFNVSKPDNSSNGALLKNQRENDFSRFKEVLRNTVIVRDRNAKKADAAKDTVLMPGENPETDILTSIDKGSEVARNTAVNNNNKAKIDTEPTKSEIIGELLKEKLDEFTEISNGEAITGEMLVLLESIKVILKELIDIRTEGAESEAEDISAKVSELELMLKANQNAMEISNKLKTLIPQVLNEIRTDAAVEYEGQKKSNTAEQLPVNMAPEVDINKDVMETPKIENTIYAVPSEKPIEKPIEKPDETLNERPIEKQTEKPDEKPKIEVSVKPLKTGVTETVAKEEDIKEPIDDKIEKLTVEDKPEKSQQTEKDNYKKTDKDAFKTTDINHNKQDVEAANLRQEENTTISKAEEIKHQSTAVKAQSPGRHEIVSQIVKKAEVILSGLQSEMRMQLEPENLGKLTLRIAVERGLITAKFTAESYEVKQTIESNFNELKDMLQEKGLEIQNLSVSVGNGNKEFDYRNNSEQWNDKFKTGGKNTQHGMYDGYLESVGAEVKINPYSFHSGKFDQRA